jgi:hypothetical protein
MKIEKPRRLSAEELILETSMIVVVRGYKDSQSPDLRPSRLMELRCHGLVVKIV